MNKGRPKSENLKEIILKVRLTEELNNQLNYICKEYNKTKSDVVRNLIREESYLLYYGHYEGNKK